MGEVYAALDETLKRRVALKAIRNEHRLDAQAKARFLREAQILSQLDHPHACRVYDYIEGADSDWLVLELIEGENLRRAMDAGLKRAEKLRIAEQVAQVLVAVHAAGIVHRDLKPGNVMLGRGGEVKVLDFGLARSDFREPDLGLEPGTGESAVPRAVLGLVQNAAATVAMDATVAIAETLLDNTKAWVPDCPGEARCSGTPARNTPVEFRTEHGAVMGTPAWMSPEQARGELATPASDMYSFGLLLQELFTGRPPYEPGLDRQALFDKARRGETPAPVGLETDLATLILRLKSLAPSQRPTAFDALERLRWIHARPKRRARRLAVVLAGGVVVLAALKYTTDLARERTAAVAARTEADGRRSQAEGLIGFMLGDLRKKLEAVGRIDILDEVGVKAMDYFAAVPESSLSDEELLRRSTALYQIGTVRVAQGQLEAATRSFEESLSLATALVSRDPNDGNRIFEQAQSRFWVGYVQWRRRNLEAALDHFRTYLGLAERLVGLDPRNADWQLELASANSNLGSVLQEQGDMEGALGRFRACLAIEQEGDGVKH